MSDPLLTSLCTICHTQAYRYKCPRCGVRTCSVSCIQKHKVRAACDGKRNPAAYVPASRLRSEAGIDHDYNFLKGIEHARERSEKELIEERALMREKELRPARPADEARRFQKVWYGDELHHVPIVQNGRGGGDADGTSAAAFDKHVRRRLRMNDIEVSTMPKGMQRQRENKTAFNRRTSTINWQVEWLVYGYPVETEHEQQQQPTRILHKSLDMTPLSQALASALEWIRTQTERQKRIREDAEDVSEDEQQHPKKKRKQAWKKKKSREGGDDNLPGQSLATSTWPQSEYTVQSPYTAQWSHTSCFACVPETIEDQTTKWQFFLHQVGRTTTGSQKTLIPLSSTESLLDALSGRTVVEFPTVYAMAPSMALPEGHLLGSSTARRQRESIDLSDPAVVSEFMHYRGPEIPPSKERQKEPRQKFKNLPSRKPWLKQKPSREAAPVDEPPSAGDGPIPDVPEEGEVDSDGEDMQAVMDTRSKDGWRDIIPTEKEEEEDVEEEEIVAQKGKGLVDYASSGDSD